MVLKLGIVAHLTRVLAPEGFGILGWGTALVSYLVLLSTFGLDIVGTREAARQTGDHLTLVEHIIGVRLMIGSVLLVVMVVVLWSLPVSTLLRMVLIAQGGMLVVQALDVEWFYRGIERMRAVAVRNLTADVAQLIGVLAWVRDPTDIVKAAWISTAAMGLVASGMLMSYFRDFGWILPRVDRTVWAKLVRPAAPLALAALMVAVYYSSDRLMLGWLRGAGDVGQYEAAYRLMGVVVAPGHILSQAYFPSLVAGAESQALRLTHGKEYATLMMAIGWPLAAIMAVLAEPVMVWFAGTAYQAAALPLAILMGSVAAVYLNVVLGQSLLAWNYNRMYLIAVTSGAVFNVGANLFLIPKYGAAGAAAATVGAELVAMMVVAYGYRKATGSLPLGAAWKAGVLAGGAAGATWWLLQAGLPAWSAAAGGGMSALSAVMGWAAWRGIRLRGIIESAIRG